MSIVHIHIKMYINFEMQTFAFAFEYLGIKNSNFKYMKIKYS